MKNRLVKITIDGIKVEVLGLSTPCATYARALELVESIKQTHNEDKLTNTRDTEGI